MEKKRLITALGLLVFFVFSANAQQGGFNGPGNQPGDQGGGFSGPSAVTTVAQAKRLRDDTHVLLRGNIQRALGDEKYQFSDGTGVITVDIDRRVWGALSVTENDTVEISGEIDRGRNGVEVDVDRIRKL